ncbi:hypothetical protein Aple_018190 [Acrocarpospora pleiomorpha]|uniref:Uncharacterized protein n=1 Tax=Acrocarpospora pleiomorpha TaxID=90975 RepID=A0A5M3XCK7_9ACTN|nr:hypothetical protein [Acrocarpospora pleiomorpha]GES18924.1 hypothetical protein Aple_018190 [Acrocarpospora pleiomorpha]
MDVLGELGDLLDELVREPVRSRGRCAKYSDHLIGFKAYVNALVRLKNGEADLPAFQAGLARVSGRPDIDVWNLEAKFFTPARTFGRFESAYLLAFGVAAFAAAVVLVGQPVARFTTAAPHARAAMLTRSCSELARSRCR